ncbi:MAG: cytochrome c biogenesis CcdA family protein [Gemmatimonadota bacterium]
MGALLGSLSAGLAASPMVALVAAAGWGVASVVLSPCHLAGIPLIIGYIASPGSLPTPRRAFTLSTAFAVGILVTIGLVGAVTAAVGRTVGELGPAVTYAVAVVFLVVGLYLLDVIRLPEWGGLRSGRGGGGVRGAFGLGLTFGLALGPCTFAFLAPVLGAGLAVAATAPVVAVGLVLAFGAGHCAVIVAAGSSAGGVQKLMDWNDGAGSGILLTLRRVSGVLVLLGGV